MAFDGNEMWAGNSKGGLISFDTSGVFRRSNSLLGGEITALAFDGTHIWIGHITGTLNLVEASTGKQITEHELDFIEGSVTGLVFDGGHIWATDGGKDLVFKINASDFSLVGSYPTGGGTVPAGVSFDGANIWIVNSGNDSVMIK